MLSGAWREAASAPLGHCDEEQRKPPQAARLFVQRCRLQFGGLWSRMHLARKSAITESQNHCQSGVKD
jgi:hypothetical protein